MNQVKIFEIPIYSMKKETFDNRWKSYFKNNFDEEIMESIKY